MNQQSGNKVQGNETIILTEARPTLANKRQREIQKQACAPRMLIDMAFYCPGARDKADGSCTFGIRRSYIECKPCT